MKKLNKIISALSVLLVFFFASCNISGISEEVKYTVSYGLQNIEDDEYTIDYTETLKGTSGDSIPAITKKYDGFTVQDYSSEKIEEGKSILIKFNRNIITYNLDFNEGTVTDENGNALSSTTVSGKYGAAVTYPVPVKAGYALDDFYDSEENAAPETFTENSSYTAVYVKCTNSFTVHYLLQNLEDDEYTESTADAETLYGNAGETTNVSAKIIPGFTAQSITQQIINSDNSTEVTVKYDRKLITIYIDLQGAKGTNYIQKKYGAALTEDDLSKLKTPVRTGYDFYAYDFSEETEFSLENDEQTLINTVWKGINEAAYVINIYLEKSNASDTNKYEFKESFYGTGTTDTKTGFSVSGSELTVSGKTKSYAGFTPLENNEDIIIAADDSSVLNLYFNRKLITVTFDFSGGNLNGNATYVISGKYGTAISAEAVSEIESTVQKKGYTFDSWDTLLTTYPACNSVVTAEWTGNTYTVTYINTSDTTQTQDVNYLYGEEYTVPVKDTVLPEGTSNTDLSFFTGTGGLYGWKLSEDDADITYKSGESFVLPESVTETTESLKLYTAWTSNYYNVNHHKMDQSLKYSNTETEKLFALPGSEVKVVPRSYVGYVINTEGTKAYPEKITVADNASEVTNVDIYYDLKKVTITFVTNGGVFRTIEGFDSNNSSTNYYLSSYLNKYYSLVEKSGYNLKGWKGDSPYVVGDFYRYPAEDAVYEAEWELANYTITYSNLNGVDNSKNKTSYTFEDSFELQNLDSISGYSFEGWYSDSALTQKVTSVSLETMGNLTFYAKWKPEYPFVTTIQAVGDIIYTDGKVFHPIDGIDFSYVSWKNDEAMAIVAYNHGTDESPEWRCVALNSGSGNWSDEANELTDLNQSLTDGYESNSKFESYKIEYPTANFYCYEYVKNYGTTYSLPENYASGWYVPSYNEIGIIKNNLAKINTSKNYLGYGNLVDNMWSCNIGNSYKDCTAAYYYTRYGAWQIQGLDRKSFSCGYLPMHKVQKVQ